MNEPNPLAPQLPKTSAQTLHTPGFFVAEDVWGLRTLIANVYFVGSPQSSDWVLVDAGMPGTAQKILEVAAARFGAESRPKAIILTHGHFDHVGTLPTLLERWDVPVYAHGLELPYLTGRSDYPPPDPSVGGGLMAYSAPLYPRRGLDLGGRVRRLPKDGNVPYMPGWRALHTPGHTDGHVSLFRESDHTLIAGDAFVTVRQESLLAVLQQRKELRGPPRYFTTNWLSAYTSVLRLAALSPQVAATGHGRPMRGERLARELSELAAHFDHLAVPRRGRYVGRPVRADERGVVHVPPPRPSPLAPVLIGVGVAAAAGLAVALRGRKKR